MIKRPALLGIMAAITLFVAYLFIVVISSPQFTPVSAISLALGFNGVIMIAIVAAVGIQVFLLIYNRRLACSFRGAGSAGATGSTFTTFTSFFTLANVGCCGLFPFYISLVFGTGLSGALVQHSQTLTTVGLGVMSLSIVFLIRGIRKKQAANVS